MYFVYRIVSEVLVTLGAISIWVCMYYLPFGDWNILCSAVSFFLLCGLQYLVNKTKFVKKLRVECGIAEEGVE